MRVIISALAVVVLIFGGVRADDEITRTVSAPGTATTRVSPDRIFINFELETASDTFAEAVAVADETAMGLQRIPAPANGISSVVSFDVTFMKQKKWGGGRKLTHQFEMTVRGVPDGRAQETLVYFVDSALKMKPKMTVTFYRASLSAEKSQRTHDELLAQSVSNARKSAAVLAESGELTLNSIQSIRVGVPPADRHVEYFDMDGMFQNVLTPARAFSVYSNFASSIEVSVSVWVVFHAVAS